MRFCPECLRCDIQERGYGFWRLRHHLPLTRACVDHECMLVSVPLRGELRHPSVTDLPGPPRTADRVSLMIAVAEAHVLGCAASGRRDRLLSKIRMALCGGSEIGRFRLNGIAARIRLMTLYVPEFDDVVVLANLEGIVQDFVLRDGAGVDNTLVTLLLAWSWLSGALAMRQGRRSGCRAGDHPAQQASLF